MALLPTYTAEVAVAVFLAHVPLDFACPVVIDTMACEQLLHKCVQIYVAFLAAWVDTDVGAHFDGKWWQMVDVKR